MEPPTQRASSFLEYLEGSPPPLARCIVRHDRLHAIVSLANANRDPGRRTAPDRLVKGSPDDLVDRDLRPLSERVRPGHVELELDRLSEPQLLG